MKRLGYFALCAAVSLQPLQAAEKRIYIAMDDHTDYLWAANEATYSQAFLNTLDYYLDLTESTQSSPADFQSRYNCDGSYWLWTWEQNRSPAELNRLIGQVRSGHISVPLNPLVLTYGGSPTEAILRGMYYAGTVERRFDLRLPLAVAMENQTLPLGLASLYAGSGARFSWRGICGCASQVPNAWDRPHDIYRWTGLDGQSILLKWNSMLTGTNQSMGGYAEARDPSAVVDYVDSNAAFQARWPYSVIGAFGKGWDDVATMTDEFPRVAQAKTTSARRVIVSNEVDFFQDFESTHGSGLPSQQVTYGNEWELYQASLAEVSASVRRSVEKLRAAEALATVVSLKQPGFMSGREAARDLAQLNLGLYYEHNWTADGSISREARRDWQRRLASEIETYVDELLADGLTALGAQIQKSGTTPRFFVFNPLGWSRDDVADLPYVGTDPVQVIDLRTGQELPSQSLLVEGQRVLRTLVKGVPSVGYVVLEVRSGAGSSFSQAATVTSGNTILESDRYRLTLAPRGAITSLVDKTRGNRELAGIQAGRALNDLGSSTGMLSVESAGPVSVTIKATATGPLAHESRVTLLRDLDRVELHNTITQNFSNVTTWGFAFNLSAPDVHTEEVGAILHARLDSQGGHYASRNARYDYLTLNHFADIADGASGYGATLSAWDTPFMKLGQSTTSSLDTQTPLLSPLVGGQVDGSQYGIPSQGGDSRFVQRFALRGRASYGPEAAMKFALEHQNPLQCGAVTGGAEWPEQESSFLSVGGAGAILWALKPAQDGISSGIVARVWNVSDTPTTLTLESPLMGMSSAARVSHIETREESLALTNGALSVPLGGQRLASFLLETTIPTGDDDTPGDDDATQGDEATPEDDGPRGGCSARGEGEEADCALQGQARAKGWAALPLLGGVALWWGLRRRSRG